MKKFFAILLVAAMVFSIAACAKKEEAPQEVTEAATEDDYDEAAEDEGFIGMPNPMVESDAEGVLETTGFSFNIPEGATDIQYFIINDELAEVRFKWDGTDFTARMKATNGFEDISGMYYQWTDEEDCSVSYCDAKCMRYIGDEGYKDVALWYDVVPGVMYSLVAESKDLDGFDILAVAEGMFEPLQGDVDADVLEDGDTDVVIAPDYVTDNGDGTAEVLCQIYQWVVLDKDYVEHLEDGATIALSKYPGLEDYKIGKITKEAEQVYDIDETFTLEYEPFLGGYTMRGLDDDMVRFVTSCCSVICDKDTEIEDEMGEIVFSGEKSATTISEAVELYGTFDATVRAMDGHALTVTVHYHP